MLKLAEALVSRPVVYVTRDIERALGLPLNTAGYHIISNETPFAKPIAEKYPSILLVKSERLLDTHELLARPEVQSYLAELATPAVLVFKPTRLIERLAARSLWRLLNPSADLAGRVEEKISQVEWLGALRKYLPPHEILPARLLAWENKPFILQFNRAHTGSGTLLITAAGELSTIQSTYPDRPVRRTEYVPGPMFTSNNVVADSAILHGNISYQITGLPPYTDQPFATVGNDWGYAREFFAAAKNGEELLSKYREIVDKVGAKLRADGWKGLFGIDVAVREDGRDLYLIEINARQPASTTYESKLQEWAFSASGQETDRKSAARPITTFAAHLASLLGLDLTGYELIPVASGAQIIRRQTAARNLDQDEIAGRGEKLRAAGYTVVTYANSKPGTDLIRTQSREQIISAHGQLNARGKEIANLVSL